MLRRRARAGGDVPTSSLADIAFLLLIFFLVTTVFDEERGIGIVLPSAASRQEVSPDMVLQLRVLPDGVVEVVRGRGQRIQRVQAGDVAALWRLESRGTPGLIAAVRTDPSAPYYRMVDVLDALRTAGADRVSLQQLER